MVSGGIACPSLIDGFWWYCLSIFDLWFLVLLPVHL
jgi:hypothetical protein